MNIKKFFTAGIFLTGALAFAVDPNFDVVKSVAERMVAVEGGTFKMGDAENEKNESPVHEVKLNSFYMSSTEVTQDWYEAVMGCNYSANKGDDLLPVEEVSWYDAVIFCNKLSVMAGLEPVYSLGGSKKTEEWGDVPRMDSDEAVKAIWAAIAMDVTADGYRLPTEAEWEYAARGGNNPSEDPYSGSSVITVCAWNNVNAASSTKEVALKRVNSLGLFDMSGNVWEWCYDWYGNYRYAANDNPLGESDASITGKKIRRGGSVKSDAVFCRNSNRASSVPELRGVDLGFRLVRSVKAADAVEVKAAEVPEVPSDSVEAADDSDGIIEDVFVDDGFAK
ncbi:SUMF1/EgtB/PvdO family nonheme iron enzyme [Treponema sp.]|uniref:formylglycine-generating enzyme family protein n=1 Tax=Treponema sp. TaxID=166 RepID=UPI0025CCD4E5|nr:SUMF1/EgtB/PvdO family nonheme iron enzyme [Treponema sp.]MCR5218283.1 formylglycine-generating enzyme family protein [Treponema sp.]